MKDLIKKGKMLPAKSVSNELTAYTNMPSNAMDFDLYNSEVPLRPRITMDLMVNESIKLSFGQPNRIAELVGIDPLSVEAIEQEDQFIEAIYRVTSSPGQDYHSWFIEWFRLNRERYWQVWEAARRRTDMLDPVTAQDHSRVWADAIRKVELNNRAHGHGVKSGQGGQNFGGIEWLDDHMRRIKGMYEVDRNPGEDFESWKVRRQKEIMEDLKRVTRAETERDISLREATYDEEPMSAAVHRGAQGNVMYVHCHQGNRSWKKYPDGTIEFD